MKPKAYSKITLVAFGLRVRVPPPGGDLGVHVYKTVKNVSQRALAVLETAHMRVSVQKDWDAVVHAQKLNHGVAFGIGNFLPALDKGNANVLGFHTVQLVYTRVSTRI
jgi:hypothetical protein